MHYEQRKCWTRTPTKTFPLENPIIIPEPLAHYFRMNECRCLLPKLFLSHFDHNLDIRVQSHPYFFILYHLAYYVLWRYSFDLVN